MGQEPNRGGSSPRPADAARTEEGQDAGVAGEEVPQVEDLPAPDRADPEALDHLTLVARAQDGDLQAFDRLITTHQGGIFRLCLRMLGSRPDAEDVVQETFIAAWRSLPNLAVPQAFVPWLYRTATNRCLDDLRRRQRRPADPTEDLGSDSFEEAHGSSRRTAAGMNASADPAQDVERRAQLDALAEVLGTLPPGPRACWLLREVHEFSYGEIAAIVQLPESTVRGRIARAKRLLAEGMGPWR